MPAMANRNSITGAVRPGTLVVCVRLRTRRRFEVVNSGERAFQVQTPSAVVCIGFKVFSELCLI